MTTDHAEEGSMELENETANAAESRPPEAHARSGRAGARPAQVVLAWAPGAFQCATCGQPQLRHPGRPRSRSAAVCEACREVELEQRARRRGLLIAWRLGRILRTCRLKLDWSTEAMASAVRVSERHLRRLEAGESMPSDRVLYGALSAAGMTLAMTATPTK